MTRALSATLLSVMVGTSMAWAQAPNTGSASQSVPRAATAPASRTCEPTIAALRKITSDEWARTKSGDSVLAALDKAIGPGAPCSALEWPRRRRRHQACHRHPDRHLGQTARPVPRQACPRERRPSATTTPLANRRIAQEPAPAMVGSSAGSAQGSSARVEARIMTLVTHGSSLSARRRRIPVAERSDTRRRPD